jgi:hypothetical protein
VHYSARILYPIFRDEEVVLVDVDGDARLTAVEVK